MNDYKKLQETTINNHQPINSRIENMNRQNNNMNRQINRVMTYNSFKIKYTGIDILQDRDNVYIDSNSVIILSFYTLYTYIHCLPYGEKNMINLINKELSDSIVWKDMTRRKI